MSHSLQTSTPAIRIRSPGAVHRRRDDGAPSRQASSRVRREPERRTRTSRTSTSTICGAASPGARANPHGCAQPWRRSRQSRAVLDDPGSARGRRAEGGDRRRDRPRLRLVRAVSDAVCRRRDQELRLGMDIPRRRSFSSRCVHPWRGRSQPRCASPRPPRARFSRSRTTMGRSSPTASWCRRRARTPWRVV